MKNIQELIDAKAKQIVNDELTKFRDYIHETEILDLGDAFQIEYLGKKETLRSALWGGDSIIFKAMREKMLEKEIANQSKLFYDKVNKLHSEVANLLGDYVQQQNEQ